MQPEEKAEALRIWEIKWNAFVQYIVASYGPVVTKP